MRTRTKHFLVLFSLLLIGLAARAEGPRYSLIEVDSLTRSQFDRLTEFGFEVVERELNRLQLVAPAEQLPDLAGRGVPFRVVERDLTEFYRSRYDQQAGAAGFRYFSEIEACLDSLAAAHPDICGQKFSIGTAPFFQGQIWCVKISDNPEIDEDEPEVLYVSLIHAREVASGEALLHFMGHLLSNYGTDPEITDIVDNRELYFIPVQNPDGYVWNWVLEPSGGGMWRKNLATNADNSTGVDLNRNFGYKWGYDNIGSSPWPPSETYRGPAPFSEAETQAVRDFIISRNFTIIHNLHTYSDLEIWPPGYRRIFSEREGFFSALGDSITQYNGYTPGISWTLYPTNGDADDWAWGDTVSKPRIISLTAEIGGSSDGFWPEPERIPELCEENVFPNLFLARIADNPYAIGPPLPPAMNEPDFSGPDPILSWSPTDTANPATAYRLVRYSSRSTVIDDVEDDYGYWEPDRMRRTTLRAHSGEYSWHQRDEDRASATLVSRTPYLVKPGDSLAFQLNYDIEYGSDYFYAQVSTDGGLTYANLAGNLTTNYDPRGYHVVNGITGSSDLNWVRSVYDLSEYVGEFITVRLSYVTDVYSHGGGVYIDDIEFVDVYGSVDTLESALTDTVYEAASPAGTDAIYRVSAIDAQNQESPLSAPAAAGTADYIVGDVNNSGGINVADLTYLMATIFMDGADPIPPESGDVNCDGTITVTDAVSLVDYVFRGAPSPSCP